MALSRTQVDKLGERLKAGRISDIDQRLLDEYRRFFADAFQVVTQALVDVGHVPGGRRAKSTTAIVDELERESVRLSQIQDIAGCRVVVVSIQEQDELARRLVARFPDAHVFDRRDQPSHGYRTIHVVVGVGSHAVEVQIRTAWQNYWAEFSEYMAFAIDPRIKYGQGPESATTQLQRWSDAIYRWERLLTRRHRMTLAEQTEAERIHQDVLAERDATRRILSSMLRERSELER